MDTTSIQHAVNLVGGQTALARLLGVSQGLVWHWCSGRLKVPAERCQAIEAATGGRVTCVMLRPEVFPAGPTDALKQAG